MKSIAYLACSSIPVPIESMFTSNIMSSGATPAFSVSSLYALSQISIFRSYVVACPFSSKAITTIAPPSDLMAFALLTNASSPSFRLIELTMHLPCAFLSPAMIVSQWEESIIRAAFAVEGSLEMCRTNFSISLALCSIASSMLMSMTVAPSSICLAAICSASSYLPSLMSLANFLEPATFVLSPMLVKFEFCTSIVTVSSPLTFRTCDGSSGAMLRGVMPATAFAMAFICSGVVPQHPPVMLMSPLAAIVLT